MELSHDILSKLVIYSKYSKYLENEKRKETWEEIVKRNMEMLIKKFPYLKEEIEKNYKFVFEKKVLPSMRALQYSGKPIILNPARNFNCSALAIDCLDAFWEIFFVLMSGCGIGISVQKHHIEKLPPVFRPLKRTRRYLIEDSIIGWCDAIKALLKSYFLSKSKPIFDYNQIREKGEKISSGGLSPGPQPLKDAIHQIKKVLNNIEPGEKLTSLEAHDICMYLADAVLSGGLRRSALISLFSYDDEQMTTSKYGNWYELNPQRGRANNSVILLRHRIQKSDFFNLWEKIKKSGTGEPGIFFTNDKEQICNPCQPGYATVLTKEGIKTFEEIKESDKIWDGELFSTITKKYDNGIKDVYEYYTDYGIFIGTKNHKILQNGIKIEVGKAKSIDICSKPGRNHIIATSKIKGIKYKGKEKVFDITIDNPKHVYWTNGLLVSNCNEASLTATGGGLCNLSEINISDIENEEELLERAKVASFIGTLQASFTDFFYLRETWKKNAEKEALLGVSLTGTARKDLEKLNIAAAAHMVVEENKRVANLIDINPAARTCCIKPAGSTSLVMGTSSGVHAWHSKYYIRRVRLSKNDELSQYVIKHMPSLVEDDFEKPNTNVVVSIPVKSPENVITRENENPIQLLERMKYLYDNWVKSGHIRGSNTHSVSITVGIKEEEEWDIIGDWLWSNRDSYNGITVYPYYETKFPQLPFEEITEQKYDELERYLKDIDLSEISNILEPEQKGEIAACSAGPNGCEIKDL